MSLHQTPLSLFPGTGFPAELGQGAAQGTSVNVAIDGQRTSYVALRDLAETVTDGRWVALGGGGYSPVRVVPRAWTHLLGIVAGRDLDTARTIPENLGRAGRQSPAGRRVADRHEHEGTTGLVSFPRWEGAVEMTVDRAITDTRNMLYPLHGLDPQNPRD